MSPADVDSTVLGMRNWPISSSVTIILFIILLSIVSSSSVQTQYIVTFFSYHTHPYQEALLANLLLFIPSTVWRVLQRSNVALSFPTDFVILETPDSSIINFLNRQPSIRRVSPQIQHLRYPSSIRLPVDIEERNDGGYDKFNTHDTQKTRLSLHPFKAGSLWRLGYTGKGVSVAVFDTGLLSDQKHFPNIVSKTDWTGENTTQDHVGHGSFVAGIIAGHHPACPGLAPDVELHIFRVFTASQVSYTSWFLDAFNYALHIGVDVLNLSIGGPDFADNPFTEKIDELAAHGIIAVSAIGNDGPLWGSLNNPGDMMPVVGVGGAEPDGRVASFSSRGMTTHELDHPYQSYGRVKPDVVAYARSLIGPSHRAADRCKRLSGTSVASPVVAGAIALLASTVPESRRKRVVTPASVKRALMQSAQRLPVASMYEQGAGLLDIEGAYSEMQSIDSEFLQLDQKNEAAFDYASRFLQSPSKHSPTSSFLGQIRREKYMSPISRETASIVNSENGLLSSRAVSFSGRKNDLTSYESISRLLAEIEGEGEQTDDESYAKSNGRFSSKLRRRLSSSMLQHRETITGPSAAFFPSYYDLRTAECSYMWPHCTQPLYNGSMPVHLNVTILNPGGIQGRVDKFVWEEGRNGKYLRVQVTPPHRFWPWAAGMGVHLSVSGNPSTPIDAEGVLKVRVVSVFEKTHSDIELPIKVNVVPPPAREKRLLWDMYHSIRYPPGYVPRDSLAETKDMLDWLGDHPHTNFHQLFREFIGAGFYIDLLTEPISCLGVEAASKYAAVLLVDSEDYFSLNDTILIQRLVEDFGTSLVVAAEWYNTDVMGAIRFEDDNTRSWWSPVISGGNVPALNDLLSRFKISFGEQVFSGNVKLGPLSFLFESGVAIVRFPPGGELLYVPEMRHYETGNKATKSVVASGDVLELPVLGLTKSGKGAILVYGDTNCLDTAYAGGKCYSFFVQSVMHAIQECAGQRTCKRMLRQSQITTYGLNPQNGVRSGSQSLTKEAKGLPDHLLKMFKPHSKYNLKWNCLSDMRTCQLKPVLEKVSTCKMRELLLTPVETVKADLGRPATVTFPTYRRATPVGSESKYYGEMKDVTLILHPELNSHDSPDGSASHDKTLGASMTQLFNDNFRRIRVRSLSLIILGVCLLFASMSLRRMSPRAGTCRRHQSRTRNWKNLSPTRATNSGGGVFGNYARNGHASGGTASNSYLRLTCSSSGSIH